jgi:hypothetical protein
MTTDSVNTTILCPRCGSATVAVDVHPKEVAAVWGDVKRTCVDERCGSYWYQRSRTFVAVNKEHDIATEEEHTP